MTETDSERRNRDGLARDLSELSGKLSLGKSLWEIRGFCIGERNESYTYQCRLDSNN